MRMMGIAAITALLTLTACGTPRGGPADPGVLLDRAEGSAGSEVLVTASGLPADAPVEIGLGPPSSEYEVLVRSTSHGDGRASERVRIPTWVEAGRSYVFVVAEADAGPGRVKLVSEPFLVTAPSP